jgi:DNA-binding response OmpR family regulator
VNKKILLIDEDRQNSRKFMQYFEKSFIVNTYHDGLQGLIKAMEWKPNIIILNHSLLNVNSIELCRQIHQQLHTIIIVIGADLNEEDIVGFYHAGAYEVCVGAISYPVLRCKLRVLLNLEASEKKEDAGAIYKIGRLTMYKKDYKVLQGNKELKFTRKEFSVLWNLAKRHNTVVTREELLQLVWSSSQSEDDRMIDTHVNRIRKKLKQHSINLNIKTVWGIGYALQSEELKEVMKMA